MEQCNICVLVFGTVLVGVTCHIVLAVRNETNCNDFVDGILIKTAIACRYGTDVKLTST
jgi:hypothetical protein